MRCFTDKELAAFVAKQRIHPVPMLLFCPNCGKQHIDRPTGEHAPGCNISCGMPAQGCSCTKWDNPPHASHECQGCKYVWRPADCATTGVESLTTRGDKDQNYGWTVSLRYRGVSK